MRQVSGGIIFFRDPYIMAFSKFNDFVLFGLI
jgi:hypothetical protein